VHQNATLTQVPGFSNLIAITSGSFDGIGLTYSGQVRSFMPDSIDPPPISLSNVVMISAGDQHGMALVKGGSVVSWGAGSYFNTNQPPGLTNVISIACAWQDCMVLHADGRISIWGIVYPDTNYPAGVTNIVDIDAGSKHYAALRNDGRAFVWGYNDHGELNIPSSATNIMTIACGLHHMLALRRDGTVVAWGSNLFGQTNVPAGLSNVVAIAGGHYHSVALKADGTVQSWGGRFGPGALPIIDHVAGIGAGYDFNLFLVVSNAPSVARQLTVQPAGDPVKLSIAIPTELGKRYYWEMTDQLENGFWNMSPAVAGTGEPILLQDNPSVGGKIKLYRIRSQ
jgi:alpha-tubulin suppressor-like RCC1 family protein